MHTQAHAHTGTCTCAHTGTCTSANTGACTHLAARHPKGVLERRHFPGVTLALLICGGSSGGGSGLSCLRGLGQVLL